MNQTSLFEIVEDSTAAVDFFLGRVDPATLSRIRSSDFVVFDLETTGLTRWAKPIAMAKGAKIGGQTLARYRIAHPGCKVDVRVRTRIVSVQLSDGGKLAFDLDELSAADKAALIEACLHQQIVIGWNLGFDYAFALGASKAWKPSLTIDVMLLARCVRPGLFWKVHMLAAQKCMADSRILETVKPATEDVEDQDVDEDLDEVDVPAAVKIVRKGEASGSLDAVSVALGLGKLDKTYQKPANWAVSILSRGHYDYVMGDISAPLDILKRMYPGRESMDSIIEAMRDEDTANGCEFQDIFEQAPYELALVHDRGLPVHLPTVQAVQEHRAGLVPYLVEELLKHMPGMADFRAQLLSAKVSVTKGMKQVLGAYAKENDCILDASEDGTPIIQAKAAKLKGAFKLEGWCIWDQLQHARKTLGSCGEYTLLSETDKSTPGWARVHPLISCMAATLRTTAKTPNAQNMERASDQPPAVFMPAEPSFDVRQTAWLELQFRSIIRARPGHKIVLADYGQIELRIAAALAQRCIDEIKRAYIEEFNAPEWVKKAIFADERPVITGEFTMAAEFWDLWQKVKARGNTMARLFREGVDPHMYTGLRMAVRQSVVELPEGVDAMGYLKGLDKAAAGALKKLISVQRTGAKALNFGLLYGMGAESLWVQGIVTYGLTWTLEEATAARTEWLLELFPEIALWQLWHKQCHRDSKHNKTAVLRRTKWMAKLGIVNEQFRHGTTLGGRPFCDPDTRILNYMDQGTGASMAVYAIVSMDDVARAHIISFVHDEIVLEVPDALVDVCKQQLESSMVRAGGRFLSGYRIPVEAEAIVVDTWIKD